MERTPSVLGRYLERAGVTVAEFAARIGKNHGSVWRWAYSERDPELEIAALIERGTGGAVPMSSWDHIGRVCQVAPRGKSTKRGRLARSVADSTDISRTSRSRRHAQ